MVQPGAVFTLIEPLARATSPNEEEDAEGDAAVAGRDSASDAAEEDADLVEPAAGGGVIFMPPCLCDIWIITNETYRGACEWLLQITVDG